MANVVKYFTRISQGIIWWLDGFRPSKSVMLNRGVKSFSIESQAYLVACQLWL